MDSIRQNFLTMGNDIYTWTTQLTKNHFRCCQARVIPHTLTSLTAGTSSYTTLSTKSTWLTFHNLWKLKCSNLKLQYGMEIQPINFVDTDIHQQCSKGLIYTFKNINISNKTLLHKSLFHTVHIYTNIIIES